MQQFIDNLISRLTESAIETLGVSKSEFAMDKGEYSSYCSLSLYEVKEAVNQLAEEYKGGWIPCSERLPEVNQKVFVAFKVAHRCEKTIDYDIGCLSSYDGKWYCDHKGYDVEKVLAWMPLPSPYHPEK